MIKELSRHRLEVFNQTARVNCSDGAPQTLVLNGGEVTIYDSQFCNPSLPQASCSFHTTIFHYSCSAMTGSPVTCGNESIIAGFLINNASCSTNDDRVSLNFHSVSQFSGWTYDPNTAITAKMSTVVIIFVLFISDLIN